jgi:hypothetical protein
MSMGNSPAEKAIGKQHSERLMAKADADRAARLAGHKSLFRRLLERLRPHVQQPISDSKPQPSDASMFVKDPPEDSLRVIQGSKLLRGF